MGKKGKGSGGKKGKKKGKKSKKSEGPDMSWKEALLAYQINIKERAMEDLRYELKALEDKSYRHKERNERLKVEQSMYLENLLKQARVFEKKLIDEEPVEKHEVTVVMMEKWQTERQEEQDITELKEQIAKKEAEIQREQKEVAYWHDYRDRGLSEHRKQVKLLEQELVDMQHSFEEMSGHLERALQQAKIEILTMTEQTLDRTKYLATEIAMAKMDKNSRQEVLDNDWLKREVEIHRHETQELLAAVDKLEKENLEIMSELFECTVDDLKISRNFYLTQFGEDDNLEESGILEMDLSKLSFKDPTQDERSSASQSKRPARPKSATQKYIEDKVFGLMSRLNRMAPPDEEEDEITVGEYDGDNDEEGSADGDPFNNFYHFDDQDFDDYLKLGPLELKLLNVHGNKVILHKPKTLLMDEEPDANQINPNRWPVAI